MSPRPDYEPATLPGGRVSTRFSEEAQARAVDVLAGEVGDTTIAENLLSSVLKALGDAEWPANVSLTYECPGCGTEVDIREATAL